MKMQNLISVSRQPQKTNVVYNATKNVNTTTNAECVN